MKDALRTKLNVALTATVAFAAGLFLAAQLDLTPDSIAAVQSADLQLGASEEQTRQLQDLSFREGFSPVVDQVSQSVVTIRVEKPVRQRGPSPEDMLPFPFRRQQPDGGQRQRPPTRTGSGSGFIVSERGFIVTNNHVVSGATDITVQLPDRREIDDVEVVGTDPQTDVALLRIDASELRAVPLGTSEDLMVGDWVLAIGSPGFDAGGTILESTVTAGIVSAKGRSIGILGQQFENQPNLAIEDFIQTDAVINRGNSGGPLVNVAGEVVGMNTAILSETGNYQGYGFAVPSELIRQVVEDLMEYGEVRRAVLGISIDRVQPATAEYFGLEAVRGVEVADFSPLAGGESPAQQAGLQRGDIILAVDGEQIDGIPDLQSMIRTYDPGETVSLTVVRAVDGETRRLDVDVELGQAETGGDTQQRPAAEADADNPFGIQVEPLTERMRRELSLSEEVDGVYVSEASPRSPLVMAAPAWSQFTFVTEVNGQDVTDVSSYREAVSGIEPGDVARVQLYLAVPEGQGRFVYATVEVPQQN